jgi:hypothetical protein
MRWGLMVCALSSLAWGDPALVSKSELRPPAPVNLDSMFESAIRGAGFAIESGKLAFTRHGHTVTATLGRSQLTPLVDVGTGGASAVVRFAF